MVNSQIAHSRVLVFVKLQHPWCFHIVLKWFCLLVAKGLLKYGKKLTQMLPMTAGLKGPWIVKQSKWARCSCVSSKIAVTDNLDRYLRLQLNKIGNSAFKSIYINTWKKWEYSEFVHFCNRGLHLLQFCWREQTGSLEACQRFLHTIFFAVSKVIQTWLYARCSILHQLYLLCGICSNTLYHCLSIRVVPLRYCVC